MIQLKKMNYHEQSGRYIKQIGNYVIEIFPSKEKDYFLRRVILRDRVVDVKKLKIDEIEKDSVFEEIVKNQAFVVKQQSLIVQTNQSITLQTNTDVKKSTMPPEVNLKNRNTKLQLSGTGDSEELPMKFTESEISKTNDEVDLKKRRVE